MTNMKNTRYSPIELTYTLLQKFTDYYTGDGTRREKEQAKLRGEDDDGDPKKKKKKKKK